jgi:sarcosine oxidase, subunit gamma
MADTLPFNSSLSAQMDHAASDGVRLTPLPQPLVISLRATKEGRDALVGTLGLTELPAPNTVRSTALGDCAWIRPDEWWLIGASATRQASLSALQGVVEPDAGAVVDISASRVALELSGARSRDILASACPLDLHPRAFEVGACAQSLVAKAPVFLHLASDTPVWRLLVRPSLAAYVVSWLSDAMVGG